MKLVTAIKIGEYRFELEKMEGIDRGLIDGLTIEDRDMLGFNLLFSHNREKAIELLSSITGDNTTLFYGEEEVLLNDAKDDIILLNEMEIFIDHNEKEGHELYKKIIGVTAEKSISPELYATLKIINIAVENMSALVGSFPYRFNAREMRKVLEYICENNIQAIIYSDDIFLMDIVPADTVAMMDTDNEDIVYVGDYKGHKDLNSPARAFFMGRFI
jgi:hypothetical protein